MKIIAALALLLIPGCFSPHRRWENIRIVPQHCGCTQEWDCVCGFCPPYGEDG